MKRSLTFLLAGIALMASGAAQADSSTHDVLRTNAGEIVRAESGGCVRTEWANDFDACKGPKPAPVAAPKVAAAPVVSRDVKSVYFDFGKAALNKDSKIALDLLVADLSKKGQVTSVRIAGYADRIGTPAKNEKLSKKRADNVRKYLISKGVVNAQVVETRWFGDSVPETKCPKKLSKAKLEKCLQPDRRVDVEIDFAPIPAAK